MWAIDAELANRDAARPRDVLDADDESLAAAAADAFEANFEGVIAENVWVVAFERIEAEALAGAA